jgi:hypothetical protein
VAKGRSAQLGRRSPMTRSLRRISAETT